MFQAIHCIACSLAISATPTTRPAPCLLETCGRHLASIIQREQPLGSGLQVDSSLERAAQHHAAAILRDRSHATFAGIQRALAQEGLADAQVLPFASTGVDTDQLADSLLTFARLRAYERGYTHLGLAIEELGLERAMVGIFARRLVTTAPLPRSPRRPEHVLRGTVLRGRTLEAYLEAPCPSPAKRCARRVRRLPVTLKGSRFETRIPLGPDGSYRFELIVDHDRGPEVATLWAFTIGHPAPLRDESHDESPSESSPSSASELHDRIQTIREAYDVGPLEPSPSLARVASAYAKELCRRRIAAHVIPGLGDPTSRARAAGYLGSVAENVAIAPSLSTAHKNLLSSPSHLLNIVDPANTRLGIGVATDQSGAPPLVCVVELFGRATQADGRAPTRTPNLGAPPIR